MEPMTLEQVIRTYASMVYRLAYAHMRNHSDADDVFQDVFLKYAEKAPTFASEEHRRAWLIRVTINRCRSHYRSNWWKRIVPLTAAEGAAIPAPADPQLDEVLRKLPPHYRTLVHLYYYERLDTQTIASLCRMQPATVRSYLTRARQMLKTLLKECDADA